MRKEDHEAGGFNAAPIPPRKRGRVVCLGILVLAVIYCLFAAVNAFRTSPILTEQVPTGSKSQQIMYDYKVFPTPSTLFPAGTDPLPAEQSSYFASVTQRIEFEALGLIETSSPHKPEGQFQIQLLLRSPEQWEKELDFAPAVTVNKPTGDRTEFKSHFKLPLESAVQLGEIIEEELKIRPRDGYDLVVRSTLTGPPLDAAHADNGPLVAEYVFTLRGLTIEPAGELQHQAEETAYETVTRANHVRVLGFPLHTALARVVFPVLLVAGLIGIGLIVRGGLGRGAAGGAGAVTLERLRRRYGGRMIEAARLQDIPANSLRVEIASFRDLVKIADDREKPILRVEAPDVDAPDVGRFYVIDEGTVYCYRLTV